MRKIEPKKTFIIILLASLIIGLTGLNETLQAFASTPTIPLTRENNVEKVSESEQHIDAPTIAGIPPIGVHVYGTVYDAGVGDAEDHGFPLYAQLHIYNNNFDITIFTDPLTGYYDITLMPGDYYIDTAAISSGYLTNKELLHFPSPGDYPRYIGLSVNSDICTAPGYQPNVHYFYTFEFSDEGFTAGRTTSFDWGEFISGPGEGHSGKKGIATNPAGNYNPNENGYMLSPEINLSSFSGEEIIIQWWEWRQIEENNIWDQASLQVTKDGGANWQTVWGPVGGGNGSGYQQQMVVLDSSYSVLNFQMRFYFKSDGANQYEGWYIDDIAIYPSSSSTTLDIFSDDFEDDDGYFHVSGTNPSWAWGQPTSGPGNAASGEYAWATNLNGNYNNLESSAITSPSLDLSRQPGMTPTISFMQWYHVAAHDRGILQASNDGGMTWNNIWTPSENSEDENWSFISLQLDPSYSVYDFQFRFYFESDYSETDSGWYIDDVNISYILPPCVPIQGGVLAGYVKDENDGDPLIGADIVGREAAVQSFAADGDGFHPGFYWLFQPLKYEEEVIQFTASKDMYANDTKSVEVTSNNVIRQDFGLVPGELAIEPPILEVTVGKGDTPVVENLTIGNVGPADVAFQIYEKRENYSGLFTNNTPSSSGILASPSAYAFIHPDNKLVKILNINQPTTWNDIRWWQPETYLDLADFVGGDFSTLYAISSKDNKFFAIDTISGKKNLINNLSLAEGAQFVGLTGTPDGILYGLIANGSDHNLVTVDIGTGEIDNVGLLTGVNYGKDLAYNPQDDKIYVLDQSTSTLVKVNPETAAIEATIELDVYVDSTYANTIDIEEESGYLFWVTSTENKNAQSTLRVINVESGVTTLVDTFEGGKVLSSLAFPTGAISDVPWLSENPMSGMVEPDGEATVSVRFDPSGLDVGDYRATLRVKSLTIPGIDVPVVLHVNEYPKLYLPMISK